MTSNKFLSNDKQQRDLWRDLMYKIEAGYVERLHDLHSSMNAAMLQLRCAFPPFVQVLLGVPWDGIATEIHRKVFLEELSDTAYAVGIVGLQTNDHGNPQEQRSYNAVAIQ